MMHEVHELKVGHDRPSQVTARLQVVSAAGKGMVGEFRLGTYF